MKFKLLFGTLLMISLSLALISPVIGGGDHDHSEITEHAAPDHCDNPVDTITIEAPANNLLRYDQEEYRVEKNTCYEFVFHNKGTIDHDVNVEHAEDHGMEEVHLHAANNTAGENDDGTTTMNVFTPDEDTELELYCSVPGHRDGGMEATLIVGDGNSSALPLNWVFSLFGLVSLVALISLRRRA